MRKKGLTHYNRGGQARMVDVSQKVSTVREARAQAFVRMKSSTLKSIRALKTPKGNPLEVARIAGIAAAKRTAELIPLCHPLALSYVDVAAELCQNGVRLTSSVRSTGPTGVEMEALTAVTVGALTVYDMCKALDRGIELQDIYLLEKTGGKSGPYRRRGR
ncbi:MAG: cyclic pyranopterin monophosphate synthase MoaC [Candidatus Acidiferrales bacterium]